MECGGLVYPEPPLSERSPPMQFRAQHYHTFTSPLGFSLFVYAMQRMKLHRENQEGIYLCVAYLFQAHRFCLAL